MLQYYRKAVVAAIAALTILGVALSTDSPGESRVTAQEWVMVAVAGLGALGVERIGNEDDDESDGGDDGSG